MHKLLTLFILSQSFLLASDSMGVGDPQLMTDHPWFQGELSCSTFDRLFKTQAKQYTRETGRSTESDEDKALASFYWRETHFYHCSLIPEPGIKENKKYANEMTNSYWETLFAYGHSQCNETHFQYTAEFNHLLGHCRARSVSVDNHKCHEVFLTGGPYGQGKWVVLDQDMSTVCFDKNQKMMMGLEELVRVGHQERVRLLAKRKATTNRGWKPGKGVVNCYRRIDAQSLLTGFAGAPPMVHLRPGEKLRRYPRPGLGDEKNGIMAYWGLSRDGVEGPNRHTTWTMAPDKMFNATRFLYEGKAERRGRFGNALFIWQPDFKGG